MSDEARITVDEETVLQLLGEAWNKFIKLPVEHHADKAEMTLAIHAAQNIILSRVGLRSTGVYRPTSGGVDDKANR